MVVNIAFSENFFFSPRLRDLTGANTPYEQIGLVFTCAGFVWKGIPALKMGYKAAQLVNILDDNVNVRNHLLEEMKIVGSPDAVQAQLKYIKLKAKFWAVVPVFLTCYVLNAKRIQYLMTLKKD